MDHALVLLVSDNADEREMYEHGLPEYGFTVRALDGLEEIPTAVEAWRPDVLLLMLRLGDDRTWAALESLQCGAAVRVPGVLLTGSVRADAANRLRANANGCAAFVAKPCAPDRLAAVLRAVIAGARGLILTRASELAEE